MLESFVRLMPKQGYDEWKPLISKMSAFCKEIDYEMLKEGHKRVVTAYIKEGDYGEIMERVNKDKLIFTPILKVAETEGYSYIPKEPKKGEASVWYGCISKNHKDGQEFKKADGRAYEKNPDHKKIGEFLGYPECCVNYFVKNFKKNYDPIWIEKKGVVEGYSECNKLLHYFGVKILHRFSCSPKCEETKKLGEKWFSLAEKKDKELAKKIHKLLSTQMKWDSYHGVVQVETPYFVGVSNTFPYLGKKRVINWISVKK